jgi:hypothetical protein
MDAYDPLEVIGSGQFPPHGPVCWNVSERVLLRFRFLWHDTEGPAQIRWQGWLNLDLLDCKHGSVGLKTRTFAQQQILARKEIDYRKMSDREKRQLGAEVNILRYWISAIFSGGAGPLIRGLLFVKQGTSTSERRPVL